MNGRLKVFPLWSIVFIGSVSIAQGKTPPSRAEIPDQSGKAITVLGPIDPKALGATLMHEHLFADFRKFKPSGEDELKRWNTPFTLQNRSQFYTNLTAGNEVVQFDNLEDAISEVLLYRDLKGKTIVDVTPINAGRQPEKLQAVARATGVNIIAGTGFYHGPLLPENMDRLSIDDLVSRLVGEITHGIDGTDVKAGIIGEVAVDNFQLVPVESNEIRSLRASARASRLTGAAISLHGDPERPQVWHTILDILEEEDADPSRVIIGHVGAIAAADTGFLESLLARGVYLQFDLLGWPPAPLRPMLDERPMLDGIVTLIQHGYSKHILVSHDSFTRAHKAKYGGWGLTYVHTILVPYLRSKQVQERSINDILAENPRRVLTFVKPQPLLQPHLK